ncbi:TPA: hypothetical protein KRH38_003305 [Clostridioides difficile]|uniref:hypothetical protein n=1 Tax=Clostridioides difficile TaxID=1496 RepID=UPI001C18F671|nr:hypothetical protein [Clostridioides difficile]
MHRLYIKANILEVCMFYVLVLLCMLFVFNIVIFFIKKQALKNYFNDLIKKIVVIEEYREIVKDKCSTSETLFFYSNYMFPIFGILPILKDYKRNLSELNSYSGSIFKKFIESLYMKNIIKKS